MPYGFLDIAMTPSVIAAQAANGAAAAWTDFPGNREFDRFTEAESEFIEDRDSFYMATVSESGWPYVQHRGGPKGFLHVLDDKTLAFADYRGNRQYISWWTTGERRASRCTRTSRAEASPTTLLSRPAWKTAAIARRRNAFSWCT
jgi:hypothetical protein